jgi:hypothetical protein
MCSLFHGLFRNKHKFVSLGNHSLYSGKHMRLKGIFKYAMK